MINKSVLVGRLTKDPKISTTSTGDEVVHFTLAVNRQIPKGDNGKSIKVTQNADFIPCVAWKSKARLIADYCKKGSKIGVTGKLRSRVITMEDNSTRTIVELKLDDDIEFLDVKKQNGIAAIEAGTAEDRDDFDGEESVPW